MAFLNSGHSGRKRSGAAGRRAKRRRLWKKYFWRRVSILGFLAAVGAVVVVGLSASLLVPSTGLVLWLTSQNSAESEPLPEETPEEVEDAAPIYPESDKKTVTLGAEVDAKYAVLIDVTDNRIVAQKGADVVAYPASITKMMTLLVAVENTPDLSATYEMSYAIIDPVYQQGASMAGFCSGEEVSIIDMLHGCILPSGADATAGLSMSVAGSEEEFARMMNDKAKELGLKNTHFTNSSGLHGDDHYTTVTDMAVILMEAMKDDTCRQVLSAVTYTSAKSPQNPDGLTWQSTLFSRVYGNQLERDYGYNTEIVGGKTGYTTQAGHTMASYVTGQDGHDYVIVTMGGSNRYKATYDHLNILLRHVCGDTENTYD